jgi:hypothetical protein
MFKIVISLAVISHIDISHIDVSHTVVSHTSAMVLAVTPEVPVHQHGRHGYARAADEVAPPGVAVQPPHYLTSAHRCYGPRKTRVEKERHSAAARNQTVDPHLQEGLSVQRQRVYKQISN